jgi:hypothetical protein
MTWTEQLLENLRNVDMGAIFMKWTEHWFWGALTLACLVWYSTITIYVAIKGAFDIKTMLKALKDGGEE